MSVGWFVVLEREIPGLDTFINGKALAKVAGKLDSKAKREGIRPLMSFFSTSRKELMAFAEDHGVDAANPPAEKWFLPEEGLETISFMKEQLKDKQGSEEALKDLQEFQGVLESARKQGVKWHLAIDF